MTVSGKATPPLTERRVCLPVVGSPGGGGEFREPLDAAVGETGQGEIGQEEIGQEEIGRRLGGEGGDWRRLGTAPELPGFGNSGAPAGAMMEFGGCPRRKRSKRSATGSDLLASICSRTPLPIPTSGSFGHIPSKSGQRNLLLGLKFIF